MSWTDIFPVIECPDHDTLSTSIEPASFRIQQFCRGDQNGPLVALSLFEGLGESALDSAVNIIQLVERARPDVKVRVYLSSSLSGYFTNLQSLGAEVALMEANDSELLWAPMWPLLALEEGNRGITISHIKGSDVLLTDIARTDRLLEQRLGGWRETPTKALAGFKDYRPLSLDRLACAIAIPIRQLLAVFAEAKGDPPATGSADKRCSANHAARRRNEEIGEWFLLTSIFPAVAAEGLVTYCPWDSLPTSPLYCMDIEYVTWSNERSTVEMYFDPNVTEEKEKSKKPIPRKIRVINKKKRYAVRRKVKPYR